MNAVETTVLDNPPLRTTRPPRPLRVAHLTDADVFAGTEQHILELTRELRQQGVEAFVACPGEGALARAARAQGIECVAIEKRGLLDVTAVARLRRMLIDGEADILHAHNGRTALLAALAVRMAGRGALVTTQHFLEPAHTTRRGWKAAVSRAAHRWVERHTRQCIAVSAAAEKGMLQRHAELAAKLTIIPNGISAPDPDAVAQAHIRESLRIPAGAPLIACVARLELEKDITTLIAGMPQILAEFPDACCVIAGEGSLRSMLENRIRSADLESSVRLAGFIKDAPALIAAADLFVLPSRAEPFGLVLLEAMALGKAVVSTAAGGPLEIVEDGVTGLLVPPGNATALAAAIRRLLAEPETRRSMGSGGRARFEEKFTAHTMGAATLAVYHRAVQTPVR